jgi:probable HAF family extracellular repeat protein
MGAGQQSKTGGSESPDAFLYRNGKMTDLNSLIDPGCDLRLGCATAISDNGQIVGFGVNSAWEGHAFLLTPIPEPPTFVIFGVGAISLLAYAWRRPKG